MIIKEFRENLIDYPKRLSYFDYAKINGDVITDKDKRKMDIFFEENADREIVSFTISLKNKDVYVSIK